MYRQRVERSDTVELHAGELQVHAVAFRRCRQVAQRTDLFIDHGEGIRISSFVTFCRCAFSRVTLLPVLQSVPAYFLTGYLYRIYEYVRHVCIFIQFVVVEFYKSISSACPYHAGGVYIHGIIVQVLDGESVLKIVFFKNRQVVGCNVIIG